MFTRDDYLKHRCTHREYYAQFVNDFITSSVVSYMGTKTLKESRDPHLNDIPLCSWDEVARLTKNRITEQLLRDAGDYCTLSGLVSICKEAARQVIESINSKTEED